MAVSIAVLSLLAAAVTAATRPPKVASQN
jgi:hypothetical protein